MTAASNTKPRPYADAPRLPDLPEIDPAELVSAAFPLELEIGSGRGGFLFERLHAVPELSMLGFEIRRKWASIVDSKLRAQGFGHRARVFAEDARFALAKLPAASLSRAFIHFPDPWWKKRHQKRLVIGPVLLAELARTVRSGGELFIQTDVEERASDYERLLAESAGFGPARPGPRLPENPFEARSPRERRAMADGLPIHRLLYRRA